MIRTIRIFISLTLISIMVACSSGGSEFLGKWQNIKDPKDRFEVIKNGDHFLILQPSKFSQNKEEIIKTSAILKDNQLEAEFMHVRIPISYIKESDTLLWNGAEYRRDK